MSGFWIVSQLPVLISKGLEEGAQKYLQHYVQAANVAIV